MWNIDIVFLDKDLRIRRFTSRTGVLFRFRSSDIGRQISDFSHRLERPQLYDGLRTVLETGEPLLAEVCDDQGRTYLLRIAPVRKADADGGLILSLTDITALDAARRSVS